MREEDHLEGGQGGKKLQIQAEQTRFKLGKEIGSGTFGKVYEGIDTRTGEKVAVKEAYQDKKYKNRELEVLSGLRHDNIVDMKNYYFKTKGERKYLYIAMDMYETNLLAMLKQYRREKKKFAPIEVKILAFQLFKALYYLKTKKVCHRDLKPPNILLNPQTLELRLCDFGSAKVFSQVEKNVTYICSRYYRAPQLLFEYGMYGTEIDVWSAGCILVEFLTREPIFPGDSAVEQLIEIIKVIGVPSEAYMSKYASQYKESIDFPPIPHTKWERVLKKYSPEPLLVDLISKILIYDVEKRLTPFEVLKHPYFHELANPEHKEARIKLPNLLKFTNLLISQTKPQILQLQKLYSVSTCCYKHATSIEKDLECSLKLQTADTTPQPGEEYVHKPAIVNTTDTLNSKGSITVINGSGQKRQIVAV